MPRKYLKPKNNYRVVIAYKGHTSDGEGWCEDVEEAISNFNSVTKKNSGWVWCELYYDGKLIKKKRVKPKK